MYVNEKLCCEKFIDFDSIFHLILLTGRRNAKTRQGSLKSLG